MNERIRKLAKKSGATINEGFDGNKNFVYGITMSPEELEKFAELIVKECLDACSRANEIRYFVPPTQEQVVLSCMREIEKHFGVKEL